MNTELRIYVACLASYNSGTLHGAWIDCDGKGADDIQDEVNAMLRASPFPNVMIPCPAEGILCPFGTYTDGTRSECPTCRGRGEVPSSEESAIHDTEGFGDLIGEYTSFADVAKHAAMIAEHGDAWLGYCDHIGKDYATEEGFSDAYCGTWDSERAYAENILEDMGGHGLPNHLQYYFDYDSFARDLFMSDYWRDVNSGAVFNRNA